MPTTLGRPYSTTWRGNPPHMLVEDVPVWYRFLDAYGEMVENLYYDCLVGGPYYTEQQLKDPMLRMWRANASKRIDALVETKDNVLIIEVAKTPGLRAVGQVQVYRSLWIEDPKIKKPEIPVLVLEFIDTDLVSAAARYGTQIYAMPLVKKPD